MMPIEGRQITTTIDKLTIKNVLGMVPGEVIVMLVATSIAVVGDMMMLI